MTEKKTKIALMVVVGFKVNEGNSAYYRKLSYFDNISLGEALRDAIFDKDADFVSVRVVKKVKPKK